MSLSNGDINAYRIQHLSVEPIVTYFRSHVGGTAFSGGTPGIGKTVRNAELIKTLLPYFSKIIFATSQHRTKDDMAVLLASLLPDVQVERDPDLCGSDRHQKISYLDSLELGHLITRHRVCATCENQSRCGWYSSESTGAQVQLMTQDYLVKNETRIDPNTFILLDEDKFLSFPIDVSVKVGELIEFHGLLKQFPKLSALKNAIIAILSQESPSKLPEYHRYETLPLYSLLAERGMRNLVPFISDYSVTRPVRHGEIYLSRRRLFPNNPIFLTAFGLNKALVDHHFGREFHDLSPAVDFVHPKSKFYAISSGSTSNNAFMKSRRSRKALYGFFAEKIMENIANGKKTLLAGRKNTIYLITKEFPEYFSPDHPIRVVHFQEQTGAAYDGLTTIPIVHYGIEGINVFKEYDAIYCLNAFNVSEEAIKAAFTGLGLGRDVGVQFGFDQNGIRVISTKPRINVAQAVFDYQELNRIYQTVGRARPWTSPTEVIFAGAQDFAWLHQRFRTVDEARHHFGLERNEEDKRRCKSLRASGLKISEIAEQLKRTERTIYRWLETQGGKS